MRLMFHITHLTMAIVDIGELRNLINCLARIHCLLTIHATILVIFMIFYLGEIQDLANYISVLPSKSTFESALYDSFLSSETCQISSSIITRSDD